MQVTTPQDKAMLFIAAYDRRDPDKGERVAMRLARKWLSILNSPETTQGVVSKLLDELDAVDESGQGAVWGDFKGTVCDWATTEGWLEA